jgi:predicted amidohydrolase YtcJ
VTLIRDVEVEGRRVDVRLVEGVVAAVAPGLSGGDNVVEGDGGALIPGLHDHHLHLMALAAVDRSVDVSGGLEPLRDARGSDWVRAVGWSGTGDRRELDAIRSDIPVRVQHRSGALWVVNTAGVQALGLDNVGIEGVERDDEGRPTGRLWRLDSWLGEQVGTSQPDLRAVGDRLARLGITGVTDATPDLSQNTCALLRSDVPQRLQLLGDPEAAGPYKLVLADHLLPPLDTLVESIRRLRPRPIAVHCVTREAYVLLLSALDTAGVVAGDRIEHGALIPTELPPPCPVVTQPAFLLARGDDYLRDLPTADHADLYRWASLPLALPSSDAPFGPLDPWQVLRSAHDRRTASGRVIGAAESVSTRRALDGMLTPLDDLSAPARRVAVGAPADLVLLRSPLAAVLAEPSAELVRATWIAGELRHVAS